MPVTCDVTSFNHCHTPCVTRDALSPPFRGSNVTSRMYSLLSRIWAVLTL